MICFKKETFSDQVAKILEKGIFSGEFAAGQKLPATRVLAGNFGVSQKVVVSALDVLEKKSLIQRRPREGVYVNPGLSSSGKRELAMLYDTGNPRVTNYMARVLLPGDSKIWGDAKILSRSIPIAGVGIPELTYEIGRIKEFAPDCLIANAPQKRAYLKCFEHLPFPVVFIGDFGWESAGSERWNQIVEETGERAVAFVDVAADCGRRNLVMIAGSLDRYYCRVLKAAAEARAASLGLTFRYVEHSGAFWTREELFALRRSCLEDILARGNMPDALILDGFRGIDMFTTALQGLGVVPGDDIQIINDCEPSPGAIFLMADYAEFAKAAKALIDGVVANPEKRFGRMTLSGLIRRFPVEISDMKIMSSMRPAMGPE